MKSKSRASYSSRLTEAEKMVEYLNTFTDFNPGDPNLESSSLLADTVVLHTVQTDHTNKHFDYALAANDRRKYFDKEVNSIAKLLSPIGAYVKAKMGKNSQEYIEVMALIKKIRGEKKIRVTENSDAETFSRSEKSFGSRLIYFGDIITLLSAFSPGYNPARAQIQVEKLQVVLNGAIDMTNKVSAKLAIFKPVIQTRVEGFEALSAKAQRIKDMVKAQYGLNSTEYDLVKGLKI
jgi:hypothetical protein